MTIRWRYFLLVFVLVVGLVLAVVFRGWLFASWLQPLALVLWAVIRIFLSVHQGVYWTGLVFLAFFVTLSILPRRAEVYRRYPRVEPSEPVSRVEYWYARIQNASEQAGPDQDLKVELRSLVDKSMNGYAGIDPPGAQTDLPVAVAAFLNPERGPKKQQAGLLTAWSSSAIFRRGPWQTRRRKAFEAAIEQVAGWIETNVEMNLDGQSKNNHDR